MKTFRSMLATIHLLACSAAIIMCIKDFQWYWMVIGMYAFSAMGNEISNLIKND